MQQAGFGQILKLILSTFALTSVGHGGYQAYQQWPVWFCSQPETSSDGTITYSLSFSGHPDEDAVEQGMGYRTGGSDKGNDAYRGILRLGLVSGQSSWIEMYFSTEEEDPRDDVTLELDHLSSLSRGCTNDGWSPVRITVNDDEIVESYSPPSHSRHTDSWPIAESVTVGRNVIRIEAEDSICSHYWLFETRVLARASRTVRLMVLRHLADAQGEMYLTAAQGDAQVQSTDGNDTAVFQGDTLRIMHFSLPGENTCSMTGATSCNLTHVDALPSDAAYTGPAYLASPFAASSINVSISGVSELATFGAIDTTPSPTMPTIRAVEFHELLDDPCGLCFHRMAVENVSTLDSMQAASCIALCESVNAYASSQRLSAEQEQWIRNQGRRQQQLERMMRARNTRR